jgi:dethiobiotin synthetase
MPKREECREATALPLGAVHHSEGAADSISRRRKVPGNTVVLPPTNQPSRSTPLQLAVVGTDTGVGKTRVVGLLVDGLRRLGRQVWVHKPVACGGWDGVSAEDARALEPWRGPGQSAQDLCPFQFPEPASPHLAAHAAGTVVTFATLLANLDRCRPTPTAAHDLVVEGIGGLLVPLTPERQTVADLIAAARLPVVVVTRPHLGTLNHTALTVEATTRRGIRVLGLVLNHHTAVDDSLAVRSAAAELVALTGVPLLATLPFAPHTHDHQSAVDLAAALLALTVSPV